MEIVLAVLVLRLFVGSAQPQAQQYQGQPPPTPPQQQQQQQYQQQQQQQHQPPPQQQQQQQQHGGHGQHHGQTRKFGHKQEVHDKQHIQEHLRDKVELKEEEMTQEQLQFHYFKMHDKNDDNRLDGVELCKAITHYHGDEQTQGEGAPPQPPKLDEKELEDMIDSILKEDDYNNDGYIEYGEFLKAQAGRAAPAAPAQANNPGTEL